MTASFDRSFKIRGVVFEAGPFGRISFEGDPATMTQEELEQHLDDTVCLHLLGDGETRWREMRADGLIQPKTTSDVLNWMMGVNRESRRSKK